MEMQGRIFMVLVICQRINNFMIRQWLWAILKQFLLRICIFRTTKWTLCIRRLLRFGPVKPPGIVCRLTRWLLRGVISRTLTAMKSHHLALHRTECLWGCPPMFSNLQTKCPRFRKILWEFHRPSLCALAIRLISCQATLWPPTSRCFGTRRLWPTQLPIRKCDPISAHRFGVTRASKTVNFCLENVWQNIGYGYMKDCTENHQALSTGKLFKTVRLNDIYLSLALLNTWLNIFKYL